MQQHVNVLSNESAVLWQLWQLTWRRQHVKHEADNAPSKRYIRLSVSKVNVIDIDIIYYITQFTMIEI